MLCLISTEIYLRGQSNRKLFFSEKVENFQNAVEIEHEKKALRVSPAIPTFYTHNPLKQNSNFSHVVIYLRQYGIIIKDRYKKYAVEKYVSEKNWKHVLYKTKKLDFLLWQSWLVQGFNFRKSGIKIFSIEIIKIGYT